jgi:hypothetical protein
LRKTVFGRNRKISVFAVCMMALVLPIAWLLVSPRSRPASAPGSVRARSSVRPDPVAPVATRPPRLIPIAREARPPPHTRRRPRARIPTPEVASKDEPATVSSAPKKQWIIDPVFGLPVRRTPAAEHAHSPDTLGDIGAGNQH